MAPSLTLPHSTRGGPMDFILLLVCFLAGIVIGLLGGAAYFRARYNEIRNAVGAGSFEGLLRLVDEHRRYITLLEDALRAVDVVQDELSTTRTRVADTRKWIENTSVELEALRGLRQMPPVLKNDRSARRRFFSR